MNTAEGDFSGSTVTAQGSCDCIGRRGHELSGYVERAGMSPEDDIEEDAVAVSTQSDTRGRPLLVSNVFIMTVPYK